MAAPRKNKNAVGNSGGKSLQDRELASKVRSLALGEIKGVLEGTKYADDPEFRKQVLLKLASGILPRLSEVSGEGGGPVSVNVVTYAGGGR